MKKNYFFIIVLLCFGFSAMAQFSGTDYSKNYANLMNTKEKKEDVDGSPYLFDDWESGVIVFTDAKGGKFDEIKVDLMNNQLEIMYNESEKVLPFNEFSMVKINHPNAHPDAFFQKATKFKYNKERLNGFAQVTPIGEDYKVIKIYKVRVTPPSVHARTVGANYKKRITKDTKLYVSKKGKLYRVKKKKELFKLLSRKQKKLKAFIDKHDLSHKKEADLVKIIEYYQTNILNP